MCYFSVKQFSIVTHIYNLFNLFVGTIRRENHFILQSYKTFISLVTACTLNNDEVNQIFQFQSPAMHNWNCYNFQILITQLCYSNYKSI